MSLERNDYYPFGKRHATGNSYPVLSSNLQKFNGKELQTVGSSSLRFLDYGTRMYDPTTVRWLTQDPMAEKYYGYSPYN